MIGMLCSTVDIRILLPSASLEEHDSVLLNPDKRTPVTFQLKFSIFYPKHCEQDELCTIVETEAIITFHNIEDELGLDCRDDPRKV